MKEKRGNGINLCLESKGPEMSVMLSRLEVAAQEQNNFPDSWLHDFLTPWNKEGDWVRKKEKKEERDLTLTTY